jgi:hypothetical protein
MNRLTKKSGKQSHSQKPQNIITYLGINLKGEKSLQRKLRICKKKLEGTRK